MSEAHDAVDARRQALNYAFAIKAGLGVEMAVGRRMLKLFERRPKMLHTVITGFRPAWKAFAGITRGSTSLGELVRTHPMAQRALGVLDRKEPDKATGKAAGTGENAAEDTGEDVGREVSPVE